MSEKIRTIRMGKGAEFKEEEIDTSDLLAIEFTGSDGKKIAVMIRHGVVNVSTNDGRLLVEPKAANSINVKAEKL